mgnify:FL=1
MSSSFFRILLILAFYGVNFHQTHALPTEPSPYQDFFDSAKVTKKRILAGQTLVNLLKDAGFSETAAAEGLRLSPLPPRYQLQINDLYLILQQGEARSLSLRSLLS